jgi:membrane protein DedA with SNARE-associated domain
VRSLIDTLQAWGPPGVFLLALIDSAGVPLPLGVDALVTTLSALDAGQAPLVAALAAVGSVIGCMFMFLVARKGGELYLDRYTREGRGAKLRDWFRRYGLATVFVPVLIPVPMPVKVPILCAGALAVPPWRFLGVVLAARIPRYSGLAYLGASLGDNAAPWLQSHAAHLGAAAVAALALMWLLLRKLDAGR